jgi:tetratricopeptide (TPR) repeat protein
VAVALAALAVAGPAFADSNEEAKAHYTIGAAAYERGDYATAVREFTASYDLSKKADILFNIARAETKLKHEPEAIARLKQYLEANPDAADLPSVKAEIEAREKALAEQQSADAAKAAAEKARLDAEKAQNDAATAKQEARAAAHPKWPAVVFLALGGASVVGGVLLGVFALHNASQVENGNGPAMPIEWASSPFATDQTTGKNESRAGIALDVIGGALIVAGGGLLIWALRGAPKEAPKAWLSPTGNGFALGGRF